MHKLKSLILISVASICFITACGKGDVPALESTATNTAEVLYGDGIMLAIYDGNQVALYRDDDFPKVYNNSAEVIAMYEQAMKSPFVGTWYCSRDNSCNDMDITLIITPFYTNGEMRFSFDRDMVSSTGEAGSHIIISILIPDGDEVPSPFINGSFKLEAEVLYEFFPDMDRQNKYIKL